MRNHPGVTATFCEALSNAGINIETMNTSEIRISVICRVEQLDAAVRALHAAFELGGDGAGRRARGEWAMTTVQQERWPVVAIVGATGAVGTTMIDIIDGRESVPWSEIRLVASPRSAGQVLPVRGEDVTVQALAPEVFDGVDIALFDVPDEVSAQWAPIAAARGAVVVDNSGAFRMDPDVPLVVPEVNAEKVTEPAQGDHREPQLHHAVDDGRDGRAAPRVRAGGAGRRLLPGRVRRGAGRHRPALRRARRGERQRGRDARRRRRRGAGRCRARPAGSPFPAPLALNVVPWAGSLKDDGWSSEELKVRNEARKILGIPDLKVSATCVRVPVVTTHSLAVHATFAREVSVDAARKVLGEQPTIVLRDDPAAGEWPDARRRRGRRPHLGGAHPAGAGLPQHPRAVRVRRQPAQGRRAQHLRDRGDGGRAALTRGPRVARLSRAPAAG